MKKIFLLLLLLASFSIKTAQAQSCPDIKIEDFPEFLQEGIYDVNKITGCTDCGMNNEGKHPECVQLYKELFWKSQCTAWAHFRINQAKQVFTGRGNGGRWADCLRPCGEGPGSCGETGDCYKLVPEVGTLMIKKPTDPYPAGHVAVVECVDPIKKTYMVSQFNSEPCEFSYVEKSYADNKGEYVFIYPGGGTAKLLSNCGQLPEITSALVTSQEDNATKARVVVKMKGVICDEVEKYQLKWTITEAGTDKSDKIDINARDILQDKVFNIETGLSACSNITYELIQYLKATTRKSAAMKSTTDTPAEPQATTLVGCEQLPEILSARLTNPDPNLARVEVSLRAAITQCAAVRVYSLVRTVYDQAGEVAGLKKEIVFNDPLVTEVYLPEIYTDDIPGINGQDQSIVYELHEYLNARTVVSAPRKAINLPYPANLKSNPATSEEIFCEKVPMKLTWQNSCVNDEDLYQKRITYKINCSCSDPSGNITATKSQAYSDFDVSYIGCFKKGTQYSCEVQASHDGDLSTKNVIPFVTPGEDIPYPNRPSIVQAHADCKKLIIHWESAVTPQFPILKYKVSVYYKDQEVYTTTINALTATYQLKTEDLDGDYTATIQLIGRRITGGDFTSRVSAPGIIRIDCNNERPIIGSITPVYCEGALIKWKFDEKPTIDNLEGFEVWRHEGNNILKISKRLIKSQFTFLDAQVPSRIEDVDYQVLAVYANTPFASNRMIFSERHPLKPAGVPSSVTLTTFPPLIPTDIKIVSTGRDIKISFKDISDEDAFLIQKRASLSILQPYVLFKELEGHLSTGDIVEETDAFNKLDNKSIFYKVRSSLRGCLSPDDLATEVEVIGLQVPTKLKVIRNKNKNLEVSWEGHANRAQQVEIYRKELEGTATWQLTHEFKNPEGNGANTASWVDLTAGKVKNYLYKVRSKFETGDKIGISYSNFAGPASYISNECYSVAPPPAPILNSVITTGGIATLNWTFPTDKLAEGFIIEVQEDTNLHNTNIRDPFVKISKGAGQVQSAFEEKVDFKQMMNQTILIRIRAYTTNKDGGYCLSDPSNELTAYTLEAPYGGAAILIEQGPAKDGIYFEWLDSPESKKKTHYEVQYKTGLDHWETVKQNPVHSSGDTRLETNAILKFKQTLVEKGLCTSHYRIRHMVYSNKVAVAYSDWHEMAKPVVIPDCESAGVSIEGSGTVSSCPWDNMKVDLTAVPWGFLKPIFRWYPSRSTTNIASVSQGGKYTVNVTDGEVAKPNAAMRTMNAAASSSSQAAATQTAGKSASAVSWCYFIPRLCSKDPNEMIGPAGYGPNKFVAAREKLGYEILFENDPVFAVVPAQIVKITQPIDANADLSTFRLQDFGFQNLIFQVPADRSFYSKRLDLRDSLGLFVDVIAGIDITKREAFWKFSSIDPTTGVAPTNVYAGFLPVNDAIKSGEGFVKYAIQGMSAVATGDSIKAKATIYFDDNSSIETNEAFNVFDAVAPTSRMNPVAELATNRATLTWKGQDDTKGSGIASYDIYVSKGNAPFNLLAANLQDTVYVLSGEPGAKYRLFSMATDYTGNKEKIKNGGEVVVIFPGGTNHPPTNVGLDSTFVAENKPVGTFIGKLTTADEDEADEHTYRVSGIDSVSFSIRADSLFAAISFDYEAKNSYSISLRSTDLKGAFVDKAFTISLIDLVENRPPLRIQLAGSTLMENSPVGTFIGKLTTEDPDVNDTHTYESSTRPFEYTFIAGDGAIHNQYFQISNDSLLSKAILNAGESHLSIRVSARRLYLLDGQPEKIFIISVVPTPATASPVATPALRMAERKEEERKTYFDIFPVPTTTYLTVALYAESEEEATCVIHDSSGKQSFAQKRILTQGKNVFDLYVGHLADGVYTCTIKAGKRVLTKIVIVSK
ncbi:MAG: CHAP domain-containing protein [Bacteroidota bacterium]